MDLDKINQRRRRERKRIAEKRKYERRKKRERERIAKKREDPNYREQERQRKKAQRAARKKHQKLKLRQFEQNEARKIDRFERAQTEDDSSSHSSIQRIIDEFNATDWQKATFAGNLVFIKKWQWDEKNRDWLNFQYSTSEGSKTYRTQRSKLTKMEPVKDDEQQNYLSAKQQQCERKIFQDRTLHPVERIKRALILRTQSVGCKKHETQKLKVRMNFQRKKAILVCCGCKFQEICEMKLPKKFRKRSSWVAMVDEWLGDCTDRDETNQKIVKTRTFASPASADSGRKKKQQTSVFDILQAQLIAAMVGSGCRIHQTQQINLLFQDHKAKLVCSACNNTILAEKILKSAEFERLKTNKQCLDILHQMDVEEEQERRDHLVSGFLRINSFPKMNDEIFAKLIIKEYGDEISTLSDFRNLSENVDVKNDVSNSPDIYFIANSEPVESGWMPGMWKKQCKVWLNRKHWMDVDEPLIDFKFTSHVFDNRYISRRKHFTDVSMDDIDSCTNECCKDLSETRFLHHNETAAEDRKYKKNVVCRQILNKIDWKKFGRVEMPISSRGLIRASAGRWIGNDVQLHYTSDEFSSLSPDYWEKEASMAYNDKFCCGNIHFELLHKTKHFKEDPWNVGEVYEAFGCPILNHHAADMMCFVEDSAVLVCRECDYKILASKPMESEVLSFIFQKYQKQIMHQKQKLIAGFLRQNKSFFADVARLTGLINRFHGNKIKVVRHDW